MNAYLIWTVNVLDRIEWDDWEVQAGHYESFCPVEMVFAETRGQARSEFVSYHDLDFLEPLHINLIKKDVERRRDVAVSNDPLWEEIREEPVKWKFL